MVWGVGKGNGEDMDKGMSRMVVDFYHILSIFSFIPQHWDATDRQTYASVYYRNTNSSDNLRVGGRVKTALNHFSHFVPVPLELVGIRPFMGISSAFCPHIYDSSPQIT